jgi:hypothetical protein
MFMGSSDLFATRERIKSIAGRATWLSEFRLKHCAARYAVEELLKELLKFGVCCTISAEFPAYITGRFNHCQDATIFIADAGEDNPQYLKQPFQRGEPFETFALGALKFTLLSSPTFSLIEYKMAFDDVELGIDIVPVTSLKKCGTMSNLDRVKFIWDRNTFCFL